jgi:hypothetical protein
MTDRPDEAWLRQLFAVVDGRTICVICGGLVHHAWRALHARYHGRRPPD